MKNADSDPQQVAAILKGRHAFQIRGTAKRPKSSTATNCPSDSRFPAIVRPGPAHLRVATWDQINPRVASLLRRAIKAERWPIVLRGPVGTGKSCAACCVHRSWPVNRASHWYRLEQFVRDITTARTSKTKTVPCRLANGKTIDRTEAGIWELVENPRSLWVLDDIGTRTGSDTAYDIVFELFERRTGMPMIISTNLASTEIAKLYDERIADRLDAGVSITMTGESRRKGAATTVNIDEVK